MSKAIYHTRLRPAGLRTEITGFAASSTSLALVQKGYKQSEGPTSFTPIRFSTLIKQHPSRLRIFTETYTLHPFSQSVTTPTATMQSKTSIITSLFLWLALASAAVNLAQIVASNEDLAEQSTNADTDVNSVDLVNGLAASQVGLTKFHHPRQHLNQNKLTATNQRQSPKTSQA